jgi:hypothetical protein
MMIENLFPNHAVWILLLKENVCTANARNSSFPETWPTSVEYAEHALEKTRLGSPPLASLQCLPPIQSLGRSFECRNALSAVFAYLWDQY